MIKTIVTIIFLICFSSIPIWILLFLNKTTRGYYWYTRKLYDEFLKYFFSFDSFKKTYSQISIKKPTGSAFFIGDIFINQIGIFFRHSESNIKKQGCLIFFDQENINKITPPSYATYLSFEENDNTIIINGRSEKQLINSNFKLFLKDLDEFTKDNIKKYLQQQK